MKIPLKEIPGEHYDKFTLYGKISVKYWFLNDSCEDDIKKFYTKDEVNSNIKKIRNNEFYYYGKTDLDLYNALSEYSIKKLEVAILGSQTPWYESICICYN
ncbi:hypothetical protein ACFL20_04690 [Spirochaetota bacterium]